jgi:hypothetical protein
LESVLSLSHLTLHDSSYLYGKLPVVNETFATVIGEGAATVEGESPLALHVV